MIAKVTRGTDGGGLVRYPFGPGQANEHTDKRVVAAGEGIGVAKGVGPSAEQLADLAGQVDAKNPATRAMPMANSTMATKTPIAPALGTTKPCRKLPHQL